MMVISYLIGQKYFPVRYHLRKVFGYLGLSVLLYAISALIPVQAALPRIVFHTLLLLLFAGFAYLIEKPRLAKVI
jgi:hypothetical protein